MRAKRSNPEDGSRKEREDYRKVRKAYINLAFLAHPLRPSREPSSGLLRHDVPRNDERYIVSLLDGLDEHKFFEN